MKQKLEKNNSQAGFTLMELITVLAITTLVMGAVVLDFNRQRGLRNIVLAKNETITNLRKTQSYMLSSRNISAGVPAKFYIVTFEMGQSNYTIDAVDNDYVYHPSLETISLPSAVSLSSLTVGDPVGGNDEVPPSPCLQVIFSAPFGKMYTNGTDNCDSSIANILKDPVQLAQISQKTAKIYFSESSGAGSGGVPPHVEIVPITGQMSAF